MSILYIHSNIWESFSSVQEESCVTCFREWELTYVFACIHYLQIGLLCISQFVSAGTLGIFYNNIRLTTVSRKDVITLSLVGAIISSDLFLKLHQMST